MKKTIITALSLACSATLFAQSTTTTTTRVVTPRDIRTVESRAVDTRTLVVRDGELVNVDGRAQNFVLTSSRSYIGVSLMNLSPELREHFGVARDSGVMVESVAPDSPADKAGMKVGDIVLSVDGRDVKSSLDLRLALADKKPGETIRIDVQRGRGRQTLVTTVKERDTPRAFQLDELPGVIGTPEFRARIERLGGDCGDLQSRIKELETRLKDLEKKLQR
jgi:predicted metalloprotease with PDZ domain